MVRAALLPPELEARRGAADRCHPGTRPAHGGQHSRFETVRWPKASISAHPNPTCLRPQWWGGPWRMKRGRLLRQGVGVYEVGQTGGGRRDTCGTGPRHRHAPPSIGASGQIPLSRRFNSHCDSHVGSQPRYPTGTQRVPRSYSSANCRLQFIFWKNATERSWFVQR